MNINEQQVIETINKLKEESPKRKFLESVDIAINLRDVNLKIPSNRFQLEVQLPHPLTKPVKICVIADGSQLVEARELGVARVLDKKELENVSRDPKQSKKIAQEYDYFIASAPLMPIIGRSLGRFLGPRGKMPKPIPPSEQLAPIIENYSHITKARLRQNPVIHAKIGTIDMDTKDLAENAMAVIRAVEAKLEKGMNNIRSIYLKTTMGPAFKIS